MNTWTIEAVCAGTAQPFRGEEHSAFAKQPQAGKIAVLADGLAPDEQVDKVNHGGPDMALHLYPRDHHEHWRGVIGDHPVLGQAGAFGSNLSVSGLTEEMVHIGERFLLGSAVIEVSQPRMPCWKIEHRFGVKGMVAHIVATARCGWYFRVIEPGEVAAGDRLERIAPGAADWSVARTFTALIAGKANRAELAELAALAPLTARWRDGAAAKLG